MDDIEAYIDQQIAAAENPADDAPALDEPADDAAVEEAAPEAAPLIAGKFKTQDDLVNAYKELERQFHESRQPQADAEDDADEYDDDEYDDVLAMPLPLGGEPQSAEQFWGWFNQSPQDAALWAVQSADRVGPAFVKEALDGWAAVDPTGHATMVAQAQAWEAQQRMQAEYEARLAAVEARMQPHDQRMQMEYAEVIRAAVANAVPDADLAATMQFINDTPMLKQAWNATATTPQGAADVARFAHNQLAYQRIQEQQAALQQAAPVAGNGRTRAATRTRQGAAPAATPDSTLVSEIINGANAVVRSGFGGA